MTSRDLARELRTMIRATPWLMRALELVRRVGPEHAYVAAGAVRDTVWNALTGRPVELPYADVDVVYCDEHSPSEHAATYEAQLAAALPTLRWEVTNQAWVHLWYVARESSAIRPLQSVEEGLASWPETATAVGVRLSDENALVLVAPFGLEDLFDMVVRHNPGRASAAVYNQRVAQKQWAQRWPELRILPAA